MNYKFVYQMSTVQVTHSKESVATEEDMKKKMKKGGFLREALQEKGIYYIHVGRFIV